LEFVDFKRPEELATSHRIKFPSINARAHHMNHKFVVINETMDSCALDARKKMRNQKLFLFDMGAK
jgi:hypothetical protein